MNSKSKSTVNCFIVVVQRLGVAGLLCFVALTVMDDSVAIAAHDHLPGKICAGHSRLTTSLFKNSSLLESTARIESILSACEDSEYSTSQSSGETVNQDASLLVYDCMKKAAVAFALEVLEDEVVDPMREVSEVLSELNGIVTRFPIRAGLCRALAGGCDSVQYILAGVKRLHIKLEEFEEVLSAFLPSKAQDKASDTFFRDSDNTKQTNPKTPFTDGYLKEFGALVLKHIEDGVVEPMEDITVALVRFNTVVAKLPIDAGGCTEYAGSCKRIEDILSGVRGLRASLQDLERALMILLLEGQLERIQEMHLIHWYRVVREQVERFIGIE